MSVMVSNPARRSTAKIARDFKARVASAYFIPLPAGRKAKPLIRNDLEHAFGDATAVEHWATNVPGCNWGVATRKSRLIVLDADMKPGKVGRVTLDYLEMMHGELPNTLTVRTPSGGLHYYFSVTNAVRHVSGGNAFGPDVDSPNYVLIPGCVLAPNVDKNGDGGKYVIIKDAPVAPAPEWFAEVLGTPNEAADVEQTTEVAIDTPANIAWAIHHLTHDAPPSIYGKGGERTALMVAATLKDKAISQHTTIELMAKHYNVPGKCDPLWSFFDGEIADRMDLKIRNAWAYLRKSKPGSDTTEADFASDPPSPSDVAVHVALWKSRGEAVASGALPSAREASIMRKRKEAKS